MAWEPKDMSGTLFKNDKKTAANQPDYRGDCLINGEKLQISAWIKEGRKGKFMSLSFQPPRDRQESTPQTQRDEQPGYDDDSIPF